jgi:signal transduction histidine kinase
VNQVFLNLIVNAGHAIAEANRGTGVRGLISIATRRSGDRVVITIADTGHGIPEAIRDKIFEPFFTTKELGRGTGQGLSIVRSVILKHGGSVTFETAAGRGTTFRVTLPIGGDPAATDAPERIAGRVRPILA